MLLIPIGIVVFTLALAVLVLSFITYRLTFYNKRKLSTDPYYALDSEKMKPHAAISRRLIDNLSERAYERIEIKAHDGRLLSGRYYHNRDGAPLEIMFHGYKSTPIRDFSGGFDEAFCAGHNVILVDQRGHGGSYGKTITFGIKERRDCVDWVNYAVARFGSGVKILLVGISMGAATVLYASELELAPEVRGIVADCPYSSPELIIKKTAGEMGFPPNLVFPFIRLGGIIFGGFDVMERTPLDAVKNARLPLLLIHGDTDSFVPCDMSRELATAYAADVCFAVFEGAEHGLSYLVDTEKYSSLVKEFHKKTLCEQENII